MAENFPRPCLFYCYYILNYFLNPWGHFKSFKGFWLLYNSVPFRYYPHSTIIKLMVLIVVYIHSKMCSYKDGTSPKIILPIGYFVTTIHKTFGIQHNNTQPSCPCLMTSENLNFRRVPLEHLNNTTYTNTCQHFYKKIND